MARARWLGRTAVCSWTAWSGWAPVVRWTRACAWTTAAWKPRCRPRSRPSASRSARRQPTSACGAPNSAAALTARARWPKCCKAAWLPGRNRSTPASACWPPPAASTRPGPCFRGPTCPDCQTGWSACRCSWRLDAKSDAKSGAKPGAKSRARPAWCATGRKFSRPIPPTQADDCCWTASSTNPSRSGPTTWPMAATSCACGRWTPTASKASRAARSSR